MKKIAIFLSLWSIVYGLWSASWAQPPRVRYKEKVPAGVAAKGAPALSVERPKPEVRVTVIPKTLSPHFNEFVVEAEILNADITKVSFRLFGKISGLVKLGIEEIDFFTEGLEESGIFYRGYDLRCSAGGTKYGKVYFRVAKSWLGEKNISPEKVSLKSYAKGGILNLPIEKVSEDENYIYFLGKTDSLGVFLIFGEK